MSEEKSKILVKPKILVIDSDEYERLFLEELGNQLDYDVQIVSSSKAGFEAAKSWNPDMILLDIDLPEINGLELLKQVKADAATASLPVILMSKDTSEEKVVTGLSAGADDIMSKPIRKGELAIRIAHILKIEKYEKELHVLNLKLEKEKKLLTKYFSEDLVDQILNEESATELGGSNLTASMLFFDIRNSTGIGEKLEPKQFAEFLSEIFVDIMDLVYGNNGSVNKLMGDGMLATYGCPISSGFDTFNAVNTAWQIRDYLATFNEVRPEFLDEPIRVGMGISTGKVFAGNIGSVRRIEYTVLGDPVNTASRLESLTKLAGVDILIDGHTREALGGKIDVEKVEFDIRGKINSIDIYVMKGFLH